MSNRWQTPASRDFWIDNIFTDAAFRQSVYEVIDGGQASADNPDQLVAVLDAIFKSLQTSGQQLPDELARQHARLRDLHDRTRANSSAYNTESKRNPGAVFWPDPTGTHGSGSVYETLPMVENLSLIDKDTPIGSAGSCFAVEIAQNLLHRGFNYVWKEAPRDPATGLPALADAEPRLEDVQFSANYGILFNAPSFCQIAEKAFGEREMPRVLVQDRKPPHFFMDPFRENVNFTSIADYEADYDNHVAACRDVFMTCEVFVVTLGLNECWAMTYDGSVLSRNPRGYMSGFLKHRRLSVSENVESIQRFFDVIRAHNPKMKLIVSVSPIPFMATALAETQHVIAANGHSKAVLRVAAQELAERNEDIHYFPSYEMVTMCCKDPWDADQRHVSRAAVGRVMDLFDAMLVRPDGSL